MTKSGFEAQIRVARIATRKATNSRALLVNAILLIPVIGMFWLLNTNPSQLPVFFAFALPLSTVVIIWWVNYTGKIFRKSSVQCSSCSRYVGALQWRRVLASGRCSNYHSQVFEV
jgi:hypothetical protein